MLHITPATIAGDQSVIVERLPNGAWAVGPKVLEPATATSPAFWRAPTGPEARGVEWALLPDGRPQETTLTPKARAMIGQAIQRLVPADATLADVAWLTYGQWSDPRGLDNVRPVKPRSFRSAQVRIEGFPIRRSVDLATDLHFRAGLRQIYLDWKAQEDAGRIPAGHRLKCLDYWMRERYASRVPREFFLPPQHSGDQPVLHDTSVSDDFNRANSTSLGASWTEWDVAGDGYVQIVSNEILLAGHSSQYKLGGAHHTTSLSTDEQEATLDFRSWNGTGVGIWAGPTLRAATGSPYNSVHYEGVIYWPGSGTTYTLYIIRRDANGTGTTLATSTTFTSAPAGTTLTFRVLSDDSFTLDFGAIKSVTASTDTTLNGNLKVGMMGYGGFTRYVTMDNYTAQDYTPPAPEIRVEHDATGIADGETTPIDFGSVVQGGTSPTETFVVYNDGTATLNITSITLPTGYVFNGSSQLTGGADTIAASGSKTLVVDLDASAALGAKSGDITINSDDADEAVFNFAITGDVTAAGGCVPSRCSLMSGLHL